MCVRTHTRPPTPCGVVYMGYFFERQHLFMLSTLLTKTTTCHPKGLDIRIICNNFVGLAYERKDIVFIRFIIEYSSSSRDFGPLVNNNNRSIFFKYEEFWKMIFWKMIFWKIVSKLEISYKSYNNILKDFGFFFKEDFFEDTIFA